MKREILFYSDCPFFAGCENMIANLLNNDLLQTEFSLSFAYCSSPEYERGMSFRINNSKYNNYPLPLKSLKLYPKTTHSLILFTIFHKITYNIYLFIFKYYSIFINTIILYRFLKNKKINILHINNGGYPAAFSCYSVVIACKMIGIRNIIYVVNNVAQNYKHPLRWLDYPLDLIIRRQVKLFITGSLYAGMKLKKVLKLDSTMHIAIPNGIIKRKITLTKEQFIKKYYIPEGRIIASVIANLEKRKGHIFLYNAIKLIRNQYNGNEIPILIIEGTGPEKNNLVKFLKENGLEKDILMIDHISDIFNLINASDFIILPSIYNEDFPNVILEAMSLGKPVIGTSISGIPEQIENLKTGIIVEPGNAEALEHAIMELALNKNRLSEYSEASVNRFESLFTESICINKYLEIYRSLI